MIFYVYSSQSLYPAEGFIGAELDSPPLFCSILGLFQFQPRKCIREMMYSKLQGHIVHSGLELRQSFFTHSAAWRLLGQSQIRAVFSFTCLTASCHFVVSHVSQRTFKKFLTYVYIVFTWQEATQMTVTYSSAAMTSYSKLSPPAMVFPSQCLG